MGKVRSLINSTPDGFADGKYAVIDAEFYEFTHGLLAETGTIAFGRNTFELFQDRWMAILNEETMQEWQMDMAMALNDKPKVVYSSTLKTTKWNSSSIVPKIDAAEINAYKQENQGGLLTLGSLELVAALAAMNLIDDYYFCIQPVLAGNGDVRLFNKLNTDSGRPLQYLETTSLKSGVQIIHYQNVN
jgi:dihydrofolate reductase